MSFALPETIPVSINHPDVVEAFLRQLDFDMQNTCFMDAMDRLQVAATKTAQAQPGFGDLSPKRQERLISEMQADSYKLMMGDKTQRDSAVLYTRLYEPAPLGDVRAIDIRRVTLFGPREGLFSNPDTMKGAVERSLNNFKGALPPNVHLLTKSIKVDDPQGALGGEVLTTPVGYEGARTDFPGLRTSRVTVIFKECIHVEAVCSREHSCIGTGNSRRVG